MLDSLKGSEKPKKDRIKFEPAETKKLIVENEFCKIYNDTQASKTFKVIEGYVVPIELRELNMWKNRQRNPKDFNVEVVRDENGAVDDYVITRVSQQQKNAQSSAAEQSKAEDTAKAAEKSDGKAKNAGVGSSYAQPIKSAKAVEAPKSADTAKSDKKADDMAVTPFIPGATTDLNKKKRKPPKSTRLGKCAVCGNEFKDEDLLLFGNRNFCYSCVEDAVQEKMKGFPIDPVEKAIYDITTAEEIYCTYSTVTGYPYLDDHNCINVCSVSRAAEFTDDTTTVETIEDKGEFFDDLKRFGMRKIIVNNDHEHVFTPEDFDQHVKTDGLTAPRLYFDIINFTQKGDDNIRKGIAPVFLGSTLYTFSIEDEITEITKDNIKDFKPLTFSDGTAKFCPVFTDVTEARKVNLPFKGLYIIKAELLPDDGTTHYVVNAASVGFMVNRKTLKGIMPVQKPTVDVAEPIAKSAEADGDKKPEKDSKSAEKAAADVKTQAAPVEKAKKEEKAEAAEVKKESPKTAPADSKKAQTEEKAAEPKAAPTETKPEEPKTAPVKEAKSEEKPAGVTPPVKTKAEESKPVVDDKVQTVDDKAEKVEKSKAAQTVEIVEADEVDEVIEEAPKAAADEKNKTEETKAEVKSAEPKSAAQPKTDEKAEEKAETTKTQREKTGFTAKLTSKMRPPQDSQQTLKKSTIWSTPISQILNQQNSTQAQQKPSWDSSSLQSGTKPVPIHADTENKTAPAQQASPAQNAPQQTTGWRPPVQQAAPQQAAPQQTTGWRPPVQQAAPQQAAPQQTTGWRPPVQQAAPQQAAPQQTTGWRPPVQQTAPQQPPMWQNPMRQPVNESVINKAVEETVTSSSLDDIVQELAFENAPDDSLDLSGIFSSTTSPEAPKASEPEPPEPKPVKTIQEKIEETNQILVELDRTADFSVRRDLQNSIDANLSEIARMIAFSEKFYAQFDAHTKHIFIDGNNRGHIFSSKDIAEKSNYKFRLNGFDLTAQEYSQHDIFSMLFEYKRHGIQDLVIDESANWLIISTDIIFDVLKAEEPDVIRMSSTTNPELMFSMATLFQKRQRKDDYPNKKNEIASLERRMIREFTSARYILPLIAENNQQLRPVTLESQNGTSRVLVFSDAFEMKRFFGDRIQIIKDCKTLSYKEVIARYMDDRTVVVLNEGSLRFEFNRHNCDQISKIVGF